MGFKNDELEKVSPELFSVVRTLEKSEEMSDEFILESLLHYPRSEFKTEKVFFDSFFDNRGNAAVILDVGCEYFQYYFNFAFEYSNKFIYVGIDINKDKYAKGMSDFLEKKLENFYFFQQDASNCVELVENIKKKIGEKKINLLMMNRISDASWIEGGNYTNHFIIKMLQSSVLGKFLSQDAQVYMNCGDRTYDFLQQIIRNDNPKMGFILKCIRTHMIGGTIDPQWPGQRITVPYSKLFSRNDFKFLCKFMREKPYNESKEEVEDSFISEINNQEQTNSKASI